MSQKKTLEITVSIDEDETHTDARATVAVGVEKFVGTGRARRNPVDPNVSKIGEELAAARALADLSHQLIEAAAAGISAFTGEPTTLAE